MTLVASRRDAVVAVTEGRDLSTPAAATDHLRYLLEKQPCCLLRVGVDGLLLAANDAALQELDARDLAQVLNRPFTNWIVADHLERWREFVTTLRDNGAGDEECDLLLRDLDGGEHPVQLKGVFLADCPDGLPSVLLVMRDISGMRRLEDALQIHVNTRRALVEARQRLEREVAERQELQKAIEERDASSQRLIAECAELRRQVDVLRYRVTSAEAEHVRLEGLLDEQERHRKALVAAHDAELATAGRALSDATLEKEQILTTLADRLDALRAEADQTAALAHALRAADTDLAESVRGEASGDAVDPGDQVKTS